MSGLALRKVAGVCAILATVALLPWFAFPFVAPAMGIEFPQSLQMDDWARFKVEHQAVIRIIDWLVIACLLFELAAVVGFFYVLRRAGPLTWIGLAAWLTGLQLVLFEHVVVLGVDATLMPKYLAASEATRPALEVVASTLNSVRLVAAKIGNGLIVGVAVPILALASLKVRQVPNWVGWLGVLVGVSKWLPLNYWPSPAFIGFMLWLIAMGVTWVRMRESSQVSGDQP